MQEPVSTSAETPLHCALRLFGQVSAELAALPRPLTTYRVQLSGAFTFNDARAVIPYLAKLGVTDLYTSPYLKAVPGSTHGYDVVDHQAINPEIGTESEHAQLCAALSDSGLGQLIDFVPNHMGISQGNPFWQDVLENGPASVHARFFDIEWEPVKHELKDKVLLPILGDQYGIVLERGELKLEHSNGAFFVRYFGYRLPIAPRAYRRILGLRLPELTAELGPSSLDIVELQSIVTELDHLPRWVGRDQTHLVEYNREKEVAKRRLAALIVRNPTVRRFIDGNLELLNGTVGEPRSFDALDQVLSDCCYRLADWRVAGEEINYRRFFDVNALAAIRVEDPDVFRHSHRRILDWLVQGKITGLRIDHPDGLFDPKAYFHDLQENHFLLRARAAFDSSGATEPWDAVETELRTLWREHALQPVDAPRRDGLYVIIEKIQGGRERIPDAWAVHGTTGYRFANTVTGIQVDRAAEGPLTELYHRFIGRSVGYAQLLQENKRLILSVALASEVNVLARELNRISEMNRRTRDFTLNSLRKALVEFIALFPVYRTYVDDWRHEVDERDAQYIEWTIDRAKRKNPTTNASTFDFLRDVLLCRHPAHLPEAQCAVMLRFAMKLQQLTGPVMAKGLEDTTFYVYNRLLSLNEVGGEPERFGTTVALFHLRNQERAQRWPYALLTTSTHDTKRSEDVRARLNVLSEVPQEWGEQVLAWAKLNARHKSWESDGFAPRPNDEYHFYQSLIGVWPMGSSFDAELLRGLRARLREYMLKAIREAKVHTSWLNPSAAYEGAVARFVDGCLDPERAPEFLSSAFRFKRRIERAGQINALSQLLCKLASPGAADIYQGCELWELSLVDPDNRRPVDFTLRNNLLDDLIARATEGLRPLCRQLFADMDDGRAKLYATWRLLNLRRDRAPLFQGAEYLPLSVVGERPQHAFAFARKAKDSWLIAASVRLPAQLLDEAGQVGPKLAGTYLEIPPELDGRRLVDAFSGKTLGLASPHASAGLPLDEVFSDFPVSILYEEG